MDCFDIVPWQIFGTLDPETGEYILTTQNDSLVTSILSAGTFFGGTWLVRLFHASGSLFPQPWLLLPSAIFLGAA